MSKQKILILLAGVLSLAILLVIGFKLFGDHNPLPHDVRQQLSYPAIYPKAAAIDRSSYKYQSTSKNLTFKTDYQGTDIVLSEQPAPGDSSNPTLVYYQSLGLHPATLIQTKQGLAVLVNFYASGSYAQVGQDAVLAKNGTLLIAQPANNLSPEVWKSFFNELNISR